MPVIGAIMLKANTAPNLLVHLFYMFKLLVGVHHMTGCSKKKV